MSGLWFVVCGLKLVVVELVVNESERYRVEVGGKRGGIYVWK
jgi:hypothetical protein